MSDDTLRIRRKISTLTSSLDDLETYLTALSSQSLPELVIGLDTIQQAKLQVVIPYLVYDLVFVYLKTRGLDPKTHPVIVELGRVRQYFDKIKDAEDPAKRQLAIDKAAAARFIKNAISQAKDTTPTTIPGPSGTTHMHSSDADGNKDEDGKPPTPVVRVPTKQTEKMLEREKYHEALREEALLANNEDEEQLQIIDNDDGEEDGGKVNNAVDSPMPDVSPPSSSAAGKRRRPPIDPFAGYGDGQDTRSSAASVEKGSTPSASRSGTKTRRVHKEDVSGEASNTPSCVESQDSVKKSRKPRKKSAK